MKKLLFLSALLISLSFCAHAKDLKPTPAPDLTDQTKVPLVFHPNYDIGFFGIEKLHPFDSKKYGKVHATIQKECGLSPEQFYTPTMVSDADLSLVHSQAYLDSLNSSRTLMKITEVPPLGLLPNIFLRWKLLNPMKYATGGTILGAQLALKRGYSINLGGGYHHAKSNEGGGFCVYADIPLAIRKLWQEKPDLKVLVLDLDAHQGNGHEEVFLNDQRLNKQVFIFDIYNGYIYPHDRQAEKAIRFNYPVKSGIKDKQYLELLRTQLPKALETLTKEGNKPDLIIYNAGTDIFEKDPLGHMGVTENGIIERDEVVFEHAKTHNIPIEMVFSGGYTADTARIISTSIKNLMNKKLLVDKVKDGQAATPSPYRHVQHIDKTSLKQHLKSKFGKA